jgi:hypothetical protein
VCALPRIVCMCNCVMKTQLDLHVYNMYIYLVSPRRLLARAREALAGPGLLAAARLSQWPMVVRGRAGLRLLLGAISTASVLSTSSRGYSAGSPPGARQVGSFGHESTMGVQTARPNLVVMFADNLGYGDVGALGAPSTRTPNVDSLVSWRSLFHISQRLLS